MGAAMAGIAMNFAGPFAAAEFRIAPALRFGISSTWENAGLALRMCWPWLVILAGLDLAARLGPGYPLSLLLHPAPTGDEDSVVLVSLLLAVKLLAVSSLSVSWSRFLLLGAPRGGTGCALTVQCWRFACNALLIWFACSGVFLLGSLSVLWRCRCSSNSRATHCPNSHAPCHQRPNGCKIRGL